MSVAETAPEPPSQESAPPSRRIAWFLIVLFAVMATALHIDFAYENGAVLKEKGLVDTDSYMRVLRIMDLYNGKGWYDTITDRLGAPEGLSLHWTRPVDILILLPSLLAHAFGAPIDRAVYWVGASFSSICHILACFAVAWAAKPLWPSPGHRFAALILLTNFAAFGYGVLGRADHHTLLLLMTALLLGAMLRAVLAGTRAAEQRLWAMRAGLFAGFGIWVSPEMMVPIAPVVATLGLFWLDAPLDQKRAPYGTEMRDWAGLGLAFSLAMAAVILVAIPIEQPPAHWLVPEYDKVSLPYLVLPLIMAAVFFAAQRVQGGILRRSLVGALLAVLGLGLLLLLFPNLFLGPLSVDDRLKRDFLDTVQEMQPLWPTSIGRLRTFVPIIGQSVTALILLRFAFKAWRAETRWSALLLVMACGVRVLGAMLHTRLGVELAPAAAIIGAGFFQRAEQKLGHRPMYIRTPSLVGVAVLLTCAPLLLVLALPQEPTPAGNSCPLRDLAGWLNEAHPGIGPSPIVMTDDISISPELAFRTDYRFVAGPYHRNPQAIFDTIDTMKADKPETAKTILDRRQVALIVRCTDVIVPDLFQDDRFNFYANLGRDKVPDWLTRLALPPELGKHFKVYEVSGR